MLGATNATLRAPPLRNRSSISPIARPEPSSPNAIASATGALSRAPGARISVSKLSSVPSAQLTRCASASTATTVAPTNRAPRSATISGTEWRAADAKPNGSATVTGRSTNQSCCETSVRSTRSPARACSASSASRPATPPPTMTTWPGVGLLDVVMVIHQGL